MFLELVSENTYQELLLKNDFFRNFQGRTTRGLPFAGDMDTWLPFRVNFSQDFV